jgi:hypothetical protein
MSIAHPPADELLFIVDVLNSGEASDDPRVATERQRIAKRYAECKDQGMSFRNAARMARAEWLAERLAAASPKEGAC